MIHYSCDRCRKPINNSVELRYQVTIVSQVVLETPSELSDDDRDHLGDIDELLERVDDDECEQLCEDLYQSRKFDLCQTCYQQYKHNPLGAEASKEVEFSEN